MTEDRKHGWAFWTAVALLMVVFYVASAGPAIWLFWKIEPARPAIVLAYYPLFRIPSSHIPEPLNAYYGWWANKAFGL